MDEHNGRFLTFDTFQRKVSERVPHEGNLNGQLYTRADDLKHYVAGLTDELRHAPNLERTMIATRMRQCVRTLSLIAEVMGLRLGEIAAADLDVLEAAATRAGVQK